MRRVLPALALATAVLLSGAAGAAQEPPAPPPAPTPPAGPPRPQAAAPAAVRWPALTFPPPDIERTDPALRKVRALLIDAIRERRIDAVKALMAPAIRDQDVDTPVDDVLASFGPLEPGAPLPDEWLALDQALRLGGIRRGHLYVVPYIERSAPQWKARFERLFIAGRDVPIRGSADPSAAVVARVSYGLVQEAVSVANRPGEAGAACPEWTPIVDAEQMLAWVCTTDTRPVSGLYYGFTRVGAGWKLSSVYAIPE